MARPAISYRAARRNLVLRGAKLVWGPAVCFNPGGREYRAREALKRELPQFFIDNVPMVRECVRAWPPAIHDNFYSSLLTAAHIAEKRAA